MWIFFSAKKTQNMNIPSAKKTQNMNIQQSSDPDWETVVQFSFRFLWINDTEVSF